MSWWVWLKQVSDNYRDIELNDGESEYVCVPTFQEGGTQVLGGSDVADLNITYNYGKFYYASLDADIGLKWLDGKRCGDCIERLEKAVNELGTEPDSDYWKPTEGNAGRALSILLSWGKLNPDATFHVS